MRPYNYTYSISGDNALTLVSVASGERVAFDSAVTTTMLESTPSPIGGVRTGPMVLSSQSVTESWKMYDPPNRSRVLCLGNRSQRVESFDDRTRQ